VGRNYPNPFNPSTTVEYSVREPGRVTVAVFDATGQLVRTLLESNHGPGTYTVTWDGRGADGRVVASGTYVLQMRTPHAAHTRKMLLLR
jgi:flagellar hook assembly protein FlgD